MMCDHDCFHCPYPDCIDDGITDAEILESAKRDRELKPPPIRATPQHVLDNAKRWRKENPERFREIQKRYREKNKEVIRARQREYYRAQKEKKKADR